MAENSPITPPESGNPRVPQNEGEGIAEVRSVTPVESPPIDPSLSETFSTPEQREEALRIEAIINGFATESARAALLASNKYSDQKASQGFIQTLKNSGNRFWKKALVAGGIGATVGALGGGLVGAGLGAGAGVVGAAGSEIGVLAAKGVRALKYKLQKALGFETPTQNDLLDDLERDEDTKNDEMGRLAQEYFAAKADPSRSSELPRLRTDFIRRLGELNEEISKKDAVHAKGEKSWKCLEVLSSVVGGYLAGDFATEFIKGKLESAIAERGFSMSQGGLGKITEKFPAGVQKFMSHHVHRLTDGTTAFDYHAAANEAGLAKNAATLLKQPLNFINQGLSHLAGTDLTNAFNQQVSEMVTNRIAGIMAGIWGASLIGGGDYGKAQRRKKPDVTPPVTPPIIPPEPPTPPEPPKPPAPPIVIEEWDFEPDLKLPVRSDADKPMPVVRFTGPIKITPPEPDKDPESLQLPVSSEFQPPVRFDDRNKPVVPWIKSGGFGSRSLEIDNLPLIATYPEPKFLTMVEGDNTFENFENNLNRIISEINQLRDGNLGARFSRSDRGLEGNESDLIKELDRLTSQGKRNNYQIDRNGPMPEVVPSGVVGWYNVAPLPAIAGSASNRPIFELNNTIYFPELQSLNQAGFVRQSFCFEQNGGVTSPELSNIFNKNDFIAKVESDQAVIVRLNNGNLMRVDSVVDADQETLHLQPVGFDDQGNLQNTPDSSEDITLDELIYNRIQNINNPNLMGAVGSDWYLQASPTKDSEVKSEASHEVSPELGPEKVQEIISQTEIHPGNFGGEELSPEILLQKGLGPKHEITIEGRPIFFSDAFKLPAAHGGRLAVIGFVQTDDGKYMARSYYKSNSQGLWRYLPSYESDNNGQDITWYNKSLGEELLTLPYPAQKKMAETSANPLTVNDPLLCFGGTARNIRLDSHDSILMQANHDFIEIGPNFHGDSSQVNPENLEISPKELEPNFSQGPIDEWTQASPIYGSVKVRVYPSEDQSLFYQLCQAEVVDPKSSATRNVVWVGSVETNSTLGSTGVRNEWVKAEKLTVPAFEYRGQDQARYYADYNHNKGNYVDMYNGYISKIPVIQRFQTEVLGLSN